MTAENIKKLNNIIKKFFYISLNPDILEELELILNARNDTIYIIKRERFELLGDSIVNFQVVRFLFNKFNDTFYDEGFLSRLKAVCISKISLKILAKYINLDCLNDGKIYADLSDLFESLLGFLFYNGVDITSPFFNFLNANFTNIVNLTDTRDFKSLLQSLTLAGKISICKELPVYNTNKSDKIWISNISFDKVTTFGIGTSKRKAEQIAAKKLLILFNIDVLEDTFYKYL